jgi:hypothetical protein
MSNGQLGEQDIPQTEVLHRLQGLQILHRGDGLVLDALLHVRLERQRAAGALVHATAIDNREELRLLCALVDANPSAAVGRNSAVKQLGQLRARPSQARQGCEQRHFAGSVWVVGTIKRSASSGGPDSLRLNPTRAGYVLDDVIILDDVIEK